MTIVNRARSNSYVSLGGNILLKAPPWLVLLTKQLEMNLIAMKIKSFF